MTTQPETYITPERRARLGQAHTRRVSPPIERSDIRRWALAVYWPEPPPRLFWDEEYARTTRFGGIVAPQEFNPFAWAVEGPDFEWTRNLGDMTDPAPGTRPLNGGGEARYFAPMRPGDVITSVTTLVDQYERRGQLGLMLFEINEDRWTNQRGELVKIYRSTAIFY